MSFFEFPHTRTYDNDLGWLIGHVKTLEEATAAIDQWIDEYKPSIDELDKLLKDLENGIVPEQLAKGIREYIIQNAYDILGRMITNVWFGLTDDGYFCAWIPESWKDIIFHTTGYDIPISGYDYGHLVLSQ